MIETILIYQEAYYDPAQMVLKVEAKEYSSSAYNNKVYLPLYGAVDVTVNWGDGQSEPVAATISTAAAMVNHTYAESGIYYVTISGTTEKLSGRLTNKTVAPAILEVRQWGKLGMTTLDYAFANTSLVTVPQELKILGHSWQAIKRLVNEGSLKWLRKKLHALGLTKCLPCLAGM